MSRSINVNDRNCALPLTWMELANLDHITVLTGLSLKVGKFKTKPNLLWKSVLLAKLNIPKQIQSVVVQNLSTCGFMPVYLDTFCDTWSNQMYNQPITI